MFPLKKNFILFCVIIHFVDIAYGSVEVCGALNKNNLPPECTAEFLKSPDHTMCICHDNPSVIKSGVSDEDKKLIVDLHNELRGKVTPIATDMPALIWDDKIAAVAEKWAKQCISGHDSNRGVPSYGINIGQNSASGQANWTAAVMAWYNEVKDFQYGKDPKVYLENKGGWKIIGHYTQVVQNTAFRIGCGYAECDDKSYRRYYKCNYGKGQTNIAKPYTSGDVRCSKCPNSCKKGLCDCGGKMCLNGGSLNYDSCTCSCSKLYKGDTCQTLDCPAQDSRLCWVSWKKTDCYYTNVPPVCPYMCGICGGPNGATPPPVITSDYGCKYTGIRPSLEECATYGDNGADISYCASRGGTWNCRSCGASNVKKDCSVMCGLCDGPCDGLTCNNGGTLNRKTCTCKCKKNYVGKKCENLDCPPQDGSNCWRFWKPNQCGFSNVKTDCPYMCGMCGGQNGLTPPPVFTSTHGCQYKYIRPLPKECAALGDKGKDKETCKTKGGVWDCNHCGHSNVWRDCPVMCGLCDP